MGRLGVSLVDEQIPQAAGAVQEDLAVLRGASASRGMHHCAEKGQCYLGIGSKLPFFTLSLKLGGSSRAFLICKVSSDVSAARSELS